MPAGGQGKLRDLVAKYEQRIRDGQLASGAQLAVRDLMEADGVANATAQKVIAALAGAGYVIVRRNVGTFVVGKRIAVTPRDRLAAMLAGTLASTGEDVAVTSATLEVAEGRWAHVAGHLGLDEGAGVIRRETVVSAAGGAPGILAVAWYARDLTGPVPELLMPEPVPGGEIVLIAERTGEQVSSGEDYYHARALLDDDGGREARALQLPPRAPCLAGAYIWSSANRVVEYGEFVLPPRTDVIYRETFG